MQIIQTTNQLRNALKDKSNIAFVPTMGNLHAGHIGLVKLAQQHGDLVVVSIFVNPLQFSAGEDLANYPRTLKADCEKLAAIGADIVFTPTVSEVYPDFDGVNLNQTMTISPPSVANQLCGATRPGHFEGVATVVMKLFNMVQPQVAVFGKKDFQQLMVIRQLVKQFNLPIDIVAAATAREPNGLALSSRNSYLNFAEKAQATQLNRALTQVVKAVDEGKIDYDQLTQDAQQSLQALGWDVDYIAIRNANTLQPALQTDTQLVVLGAAKLGKTRLIDNIEFCAKPLN